MCHVLIIEDEWFISDFLMELAEEAGATSIATAISEEEAVASAREQVPTIIISDVRLQSGTGPRAVQSIISEAGAIPVIFITGTPEDCRPCAPPGVVLSKPIQRRQVVDTFRRLIPL